MKHSQSGKLTWPSTEEKKCVPELSLNSTREEEIRGPDVTGRIYPHEICPSQALSFPNTGPAELSFMRSVHTSLSLMRLCRSYTRLPEPWMKGLSPATLSHWPSGDTSRVGGEAVALEVGLSAAWEAEEGKIWLHPTAGLQMGEASGMWRIKPTLFFLHLCRVSAQRWNLNGSKSLSLRGV